MKFMLNSKQVIKLLLYSIGLLALGHIATRFLSYMGHHRVFGLVRLLDLNEERNIPTFFSASLLLSCAGLLWFVCLAKKQDKDGYARYWAGLALIFLFLAVDEAAEIHEFIGGLLHDALHTSGALYYAWVIPYGVLVLTIALVYLRFLMQLPLRTRMLFVLAGTVYVTGAIGMEILEGLLQGQLHGAQFVAMQVTIVLEEVFEMLGAVMLIHALLTYLEREYGVLQVVLVPAQSLAPSQGHAELEHGPAAVAWLAKAGLFNASK